MHIAELYTTLEEVIVVLKDSAEERSLPIWVAKHDAALIVAAIENILVPRPLTHELMADLIRRSGARLERVEISDLCENTYSALIHLSKYNEAIVLDARPGDAIAIAVRTNVPIFVREELLAESSAAGLSDQVPLDKEDRERWEDILANLDPGDLGKYKM